MLSSKGVHEEGRVTVITKDKANKSGLMNSGWREKNNPTLQLRQSDITRINLNPAGKEGTKFPSAASVLNQIGVKETKEIRSKPKAQTSSDDIVEKFTVKTRTGFIPQTRKVNQDNFIVQKDLNGVPKLWMLGVMDGHGQNGHQVSLYCKGQLPHLLHCLMLGYSPE